MTSTVGHAGPGSGAADARRWPSHHETPWALALGHVLESEHALGSGAVQPGGLVALDDLLERRGRLSPGEVTTIVAPLALLLARAHAVGVVHGGVSLERVHLTRDGRPVLDGWEDASPRAESDGGTAVDIRALGALARTALTGPTTRLTPTRRAGGPPRAAARPVVAPQVEAGSAWGRLVEAMHAADDGRGPSAGACAVAAYRAAAPEALLLPASAGRRRPDSGGGSSPATQMALLVTGGVAFVVFFLGLAAWLAPGDRDAREARSRGVVTTVGPVVGVDPTAQGSAEPAEVLQGLVDARATAMTARDAGLLGRADLPGSVVGVADAALIRTLVSSGQRYEGLAFHVGGVRLVSSSTTRLEVVAVIARDDYAVVSGTGPAAVRRPRGADPGRPYRYVLSASPVGWRLSQVAEGG